MTTGSSLRSSSAVSLAQMSAEPASRRVHANLGSGARMPSVLVEHLHLDGSAGPIRRQQVPEQIMPAARIVVRQRQIEGAVAVEVHPLHAVGRTVPGDDRGHGVDEAAAFMVVEEVALVHRPIDI